MDIIEKALLMLRRHPLCDHCLGRQFALLGHGVENEERGKAIKLSIVLKAHAHAKIQMKNQESDKTLWILATSGFSQTAKEVLQEIGKTSPKEITETCFLCMGKFNDIERLTRKALSLLKAYEYSSFLVGIELPTNIEELEDEFKAEFEVSYGENMRNEFGRLIGKRITEKTKKSVNFLRPEIVVLVNPYTESVRLQVNPLFVSGRYRKIARGIPQSKWFCSTCHGKGCQKCNYSGKMYQESVEEIISKPFLDAAEGVQSAFHASGREDIDARMLGTGRPFVIEIAGPKKRLLNLNKLEALINLLSKGKVGVSNLRFADKTTVRKLKKGESTQKVYRVLMEFEDKVTDKKLCLLEDQLKNIIIAQRTPIRVMHRRADLVREKYIYDVNIKKLSPKRAEMKIRCQGGLYVKELVTGDEGRTTPSISEILKSKAKPLKLDVLEVRLED